MVNLFGGKPHYVQEKISEASALKNITLTSWIRTLCLFVWVVEFPNSPQLKDLWEIQFLKVFSEPSKKLNITVEVLGRAGIFHS